MCVTYQQLKKMNRKSDLDYILFYILEQQQIRNTNLLILLLRKKQMLIRNRNKLHKINLIAPIESGWHLLYNSGVLESGKEGFINITSLDRKSFDQLLIFFSKYYINKSGVGKKGRPKTLHYKSTVLGVLLSFYTGKKKFFKNNY